MPTPPMDRAKIAEARELVERFGTVAEASRASGIPYSTLEKRYKRQIDPAVEEGMQAIGTGLVPQLVWAKTKSTDGTSFSVLLKPELETEHLADRIRGALDGIPAIPAISRPEYADGDLLAVYPLADVHLGLMSWGKETGTDWDTRAGAERVQAWVGQCVASTPPAETAILLDVGDLTHADDQTNQTPQSKHQLDVDTRFFKTIETAIATLAAATEILAKRHDRVIVRILPGNHNRTSFMAVLFALAQRYRNNPQIEVQAVPGEFFIYEFGRVMIAAHHGDKAKADRMAHFIADEYAEAWGRTKHRFLFTGHLHHHKSQDIGGLQWEQLRAVTPRDAYAYSHAYSARAQLQSITYHRTRGEVQRVKVGC